MFLGSEVVHLGLNLAQATIFAVCARILATCDITKTVENGKEVTPEVAYGPGAVRSEEYPWFREGSDYAY